MTFMLNDPMRLLSPRSLAPEPEHDQLFELDLTEFGSLIAVAGVICIDQGRLIQEDEIRRLSDLAYTEIVNRSSATGLQFTENDLEKGYHRHFEEMKVQLIGDGYIIYEGDLPVGAERVSCEATATVVGDK